MGRVEKLTPEKLEGLIETEKFIVEHPMTMCLLQMRGGYQVVGTSASMNPEDFDEEVGRKVARDRAVAQLWGLEAYHQMRKRVEP